MAMNGNDLGDEIIAAIDAVVADVVGEAPRPHPMRERMFRAIGNAIVNHIQENLQITVRDSDGGLQSVGGAATEAPSGPVQLDPGNFD